MADIRTLKMALLADTTDFVKGLNKAENESASFSNKLGGYIKGAAAAFAAFQIGQKGLALAVDSVKAAIEDDAAARKLEKTLQNVAGATAEVVKQTEAYVTKTSLATGVADDQLRPALARLIRSTRDSAKAQDLLNVGLDIAAGTGKDLDSVVAALGKAYDGNTASLGKLGLGIDQSLLKSKDFGKIIGQLKKDFGGFADQEANTLEGRMKRLGLAVQEAKESFGAALLPILEKVVGFITEKGIPLLNSFLESWAQVTEGISGNLTGALEYLQKIFAPILDGIKIAFDTVSDAINRNRTKLQPLFDLFIAIGKFVKEILVPLLANALGDAFILVGNIISGIIDVIAIMVDAIANAVKTIQGLIDKVQEYINKANQMPIIGALIPDSLVSKPKPTVVNNNFILKGGVSDPQGYARQITKIQTTAKLTSGLALR
jgi:hypothetical protein